MFLTMILSHILQDGRVIQDILLLGGVKMQKYDGGNILHAQRFKSEEGTYYNILLEVEFTDWKLISLHGKSTYIWIYYDSQQLKYYVKCMFNADGNVKDKRQDISWAEMKEILDYIKANPDDKVELPIIQFKGAKQPDEKKVSFFDKVKRIFKR